MWTYNTLYDYELGPQNNQWARTQFLSFFFIWLVKAKSPGASQRVKLLARGEPELSLQGWVRLEWAEKKQEGNMG